MDNNYVQISEIRKQIDVCLKECVNDCYYDSGRVILNLAISFNRTIDTSEPKYDEFLNEYIYIEKQMAYVF